MATRFYPESDKFLDVTEILNELKEVLEAPLREERISLFIKKSGVSTLAGLSQKPSALSAQIWFAGLASCQRGVATGRFNLDVEEPPMEGEKTDKQAQVSGEKMLGIITPICALISMIDFAPANVSAPKIESTDWIMDDRGNITGHRISFQVNYCLPPVIPLKIS